MGFLVIYLVLSGGLVAHWSVARRVHASRHWFSNVNGFIAHLFKHTRKSIWPRSLEYRFPLLARCNWRLRDRGEGSKKKRGEESGLASQGVVSAIAVKRKRMIREIRGKKERRKRVERTKRGVANEKGEVSVYE